MVTKLARARSTLTHARVTDAHLAAKGRKAIATVLAMKKRVENAFYEMGKALAVLRDPLIVRAVGHPSFDALCTIELRISPAQADRLIHISQNFAADEAKRLSTTKATAIIDLARAMGGKNTAHGLLVRGTVHVGNTAVDVHSASAAKLARLARELRAESTPEGRPGVHVSKEDKHFVTKLASALKASKAEATVEAIAGDAAHGAKMRLVVRVRDARKLAAAIAKAGTSRG